MEIGDVLRGRLEAVDVVDLHREERRLRDAAQPPLPAHLQAGVPAAGAIDGSRQHRRAGDGARRRAARPEQQGEAEEQPQERSADKAHMLRMAQISTRGHPTR
ncbi:MAG: hypothetical protein QOH74_1794 [Gaiellales bacterium]|nr:hypothetical protein [Gaiellales bacterium]